MTNAHRNSGSKNSRLDPGGRSSKWLILLSCSSIFSENFPRTRKIFEEVGWIFAGKNVSYFSQKISNILCRWSVINLRFLAFINELVSRLVFFVVPLINEPNKSNRNIRVGLPSFSSEFIYNVILRSLRVKIFIIIGCFWWR